MPPKGKGRPIKKFVPDVPNASSSNDQMGHLNTLADAAQDASFDFERAWPTLDEAGQRLARIRTLLNNRGLNKTNRTELVNAIDALHKLLIEPSSIVANTPDVYKNEFKNRAMTLTTQYLQFSLDVVPKTEPEKDQFLDVLLDKLINPVREQPSLWGRHSRLITDSVKRFDKLRMSVTRPQEPEPTIPQDRRGPEPTIPPLPLYPDYHHQYPPHPQSQNVQHGYPLHPQYYPPGYETRQGRPPFPPWDEQLEGRFLGTSRGYHPPRPYQISGPQPNQYHPPPSGLGAFQSTLVPNKPFLPADALLPVHRPTPIPVRSPFRNENDAEKRKRLIDRAAEELKGIRQHPARQTQSRPEVDNDNFSLKSEKVRDNEDIHVDITNDSPKRPLSVGSNEDLALKRKRTDEGIQPVTHERLPSREQSYQEVAKQHVEDEQYLSKDAAQLEGHDHHAPTPIQTDDDFHPIQRGPLVRTRSRAQFGLEEIITPALRRMMSPDYLRHLSAPPPRERSPDRKQWSRNSHQGGHSDIASTPPEAPNAYSQTVVKWPPPSRGIQSHISNRASPTVIPPGGNALGARSPELFSDEKAERPAFEHIRPLEEYDDVKAIVKRPVLRLAANASETRQLPLNASNMPRFMTEHDEINQTRHVQRRDYYVHTRTALIAKASRSSHISADGTIALGRFFHLTREELDEIHEYVRFMGGQETKRPRTMIRLVFRERNGEGRDTFNHSWPQNTTVFLNGKNLMTSMHVPLYLSPENLVECNRLRFKFHPDAVPGPFSINLEVFSLLPFDEMKSFVFRYSPSSKEALEILKTRRTGDKSKARVSLLCANSDHQMRTPVYGKTCERHERIDLACFVSQIGVGPEFVWKCPLCLNHCGDDIPVAVDQHILGVLGILESVGLKTREYYTIESDGEICDETDNEMDGESGDENEEDEEDEKA